MKFRVFWDVVLCSLVGVDCILRPSSATDGDTSEMSVYSKETTWHNIPEVSRVYKILNSGQLVYRLTLKPGTSNMKDMY
jgi:hypothetical protein